MTECCDISDKSHFCSGTKPSAERGRTSLCFYED